MCVIWVFIQQNLLTFSIAKTFGRKHLNIKLRKILLNNIAYILLTYITALDIFMPGISNVMIEFIEWNWLWLYNEYTK